MCALLALQQLKLATNTAFRFHHLRDCIASSHFSTHCQDVDVCGLILFHVQGTVFLSMLVHCR